MKLIKTFDDFSLNRIHDICYKYSIKNYTINDDGSIDVNGDVYLDRRGLTKFPLIFNNVNGGFSCSGNNLTSLEGCPKYIGGNFYCEENQLTSLIGGPTIVGGSFYCEKNQLTSFDGCPTNIGNDFYCINNPVCEIWNPFRNYEYMELFNDLDIIRDNNIIILQRLNEFLDMIGKPKVTEVRGYKCI